MTTMLEKAIGSANDVLSLALIGSEDELYLGDVVARNMVRAALLAIREPSEGVVEAMVWADIPGGRFGEDTFRESSIDEDDATVLVAAMIDAILNEKPETT